MKREDKNLAYMLQYEHIAWYENGKVRILDRRVYPNKVEYVTCNSYHEVAQAIKDMVTQSGGPYLAAGMGMVLAANSCKNMSGTKKIAYLRDAAKVLATARPTTSEGMKIITQNCLTVAKDSILVGSDTIEAIFNHTIERMNKNYQKNDKIADYLTDFFPDKGGVLTQCFGESVVGLMLRQLKRKNKELKIFCAETRPYFQGARLTASVAKDQGADVTVITDNMPAFIMSQNKIDVFTSAADVITCDGHVINKIGTSQIAILCKYFSIPYYTTGNPDFAHKDLSNVEIEMRDPNFTLQAMGVRTAMKGVKGYYPAFDITSPDLVTKIVTSKGAFTPEKVNSFFDY